MKALLRKLGLATALVAVVLSLFAGASSAATPTSYEDDWNNRQNQEQYWEDLLSDETRSVDCTKYKRHNGFIPAEYDAAVIKDGNKVRVYPDLTDVGAFTAVGATNPNNGEPFAAPHSWVMKCKFTPTTMPERELCTTAITNPGGVTAWITSFDGVTNGGECFGFEVSDVCGVASGALTKQVTPQYPQGPFKLVWNEGVGIDLDAAKSFPATFDEDYNGGTVTISYYIVGPEKDWLVGSDHPNYWDGTYETLTVDTDCVAPPTTTTVPDDEVTAVVPEVAVEDECSGRGILTIPDIEGIIFDLDNVPSGAGEYEVTSGDVVKATAREGFVLTNPDFEYVVEVTVNEDCVTTTVAETTTTEKPEVSSTSVVKPQAAAEELAFTGSSSIVGTLLGSALLLMGAAVLFFGRRKTTD